MTFGDNLYSHARIILPEGKTTSVAAMLVYEGM